MTVAIEPCRLTFEPAVRKAAGRPSAAIRNILTVRLTGPRWAEGKAVILDPAQCDISLYCDTSMAGYDFSRFSIIDPPPPGYIFKPTGGKPLRELVDARTIFACCGQTDSLWASNSVVIANGVVINRSAPGVNAKEHYQLEGSFPFFVLDQGQVGIIDLDFARHQPVKTVAVKNAISGPVLIRRGTLVAEGITVNTPNTRPNQLMWDHTTSQRALSAVGHSAGGELIFVALAGNPDLGTECRLDDIVRVLWRLKAVNAMLLGASADVQQFVRTADDEGSLIIARPRVGSSMARMFPGGRPLSNAIIVKEPA